MKDTPP